MNESKSRNPVDAVPDTSKLDRNLGAVAHWRHDRFVSRVSLEALKEVDLNAVENLKRLRMSTDNTATSVALAAINAEGVRRMSAVKSKLATNVAAAQESLGMLGASHSFSSSELHNQLVSDLDRRRAAGQMSDDDYAFNLERLERAHFSRREASYDRAESIGQEIDQLADEARRSGLSRR